MSEMSPNQTFQAQIPQPQGDNSKKKITWSVISIALILIIWFASGLALPFPVDWILHLIIYFALGYALYQTIGLWALAWVLAAWFGALDEIHQAYFPGRMPNILDWFLALIFSGLGAYFTIWQTKQQHNKQAAQPTPEPTEQAAAMPDFEFAPPPMPQAMTEAPSPDMNLQVPQAPRPQPTPTAPEVHAPIIDTEFHPNNNAPVHESAQAVEVNFGHKAKNKDENKKG